MRTLVTGLASVLVLATAVYGQGDSYYYSDERKIPIERANHWAVVQIPDTAGEALTGALSRRSSVGLRRAVSPERGFYWLESEEHVLKDATLEQLSRQVSIEQSIPAFYQVRGQDTTHFVMTDEFVVEFKPGISRAEIGGFNKQHGVEVAPFDTKIDRKQALEDNEYLLRVTEASAFNALEAANHYYESDLTVWSVPNFFIGAQLHGTERNTQTRAHRSANDPLYDEQYYLNNTSSNLGTEDIDIDAPEAWGITKGSSNVTVAVVDMGTEQHEDFRDGQVLQGTTAGGGDGSPSFDINENHAQSVAGIIAANHNSKGVRGVAPKVQIMPIKIKRTEGTPTNEDKANAIDFARQNGADVLNNSWGGAS
jgi:hypothetical protein